MSIAERELEWQLRKKLEMNATAEIHRLLPSSPLLAWLDLLPLVANSWLDLEPEPA